MLYVLHGIRTLVVDVPEEQSTDRVRIPMSIYNACWLDRLFNLSVKVYRTDFLKPDMYLIFNWPARKMTPPEVIL